MKGPMRRYRAIVAVVLAVGAVSCTGSNDRSTGAPAVATSAGAAGESIYDLDLALVDQSGRSLTLADLRGQTMVAAMMYTTCRAVCPRVTEDMKTLERQLPDTDRRRVKFVLFSLDPGRDTPEAMRTFATVHGLDLARWRLLAASEDGVRDLSVVLGVKYKPEEGGEIAHSAMIFVIDRGGVVRHRQLGLTDGPRELIDALSRARS